MTIWPGKGNSALLTNGQIQQNSIEKTVSRQSITARRMERGQSWVSFPINENLVNDQVRDVEDYLLKILENDDIDTIYIKGKCINIMFESFSVMSLGEHFPFSSYCSCQSLSPYSTKYKVDL